MSDWFFVRGNRREGPVSMGFVADEVRRGRLGQDDLVWGEGMEDWQRVAEVPELVELARQTPPPLPAEVAEAAAVAETEARRMAAASLAPPPPASTLPGYANFGQRLGAHIIDQLILIVPGVLVATAAYYYLDSKQEAFDLESPTDFQSWVNLMQGLMLPLQCVYYAVFESSARQATPGKRMLKIKVCTSDGARLSLTRAAARILIKSFTLAFGCLTMFFSPRRQALHDIVMNTVVVAEDK